jgi:aspartate aminotransferase
VYISNPTWANHRSIFSRAGFKVEEYPYWDAETKGLAFDAMLNCFRNAPAKSILLLHPCAHNPTGVDPTMEQWKQICQVAKEKQHVLFFDTAYQGFASGDLEKDAAAVRYFAEQGMEFQIAQSYAKNFGLYNERVGCLTVVANSKEVCERAKSQLKVLVRAGYSNPPAFGARIVERVLNDETLYKEWFGDV